MRARLLLVCAVTLTAMAGAAFIQFIPNLAENVSKAAPWAVYGLVLLAVISLAPRGIAGLGNRIRSILR